MLLTLGGGRPRGYPQPGLGMDFIHFGINCEWGSRSCASGNVIASSWKLESSVRLSVNVVIIESILVDLFKGGSVGSIFVVIALSCALSGAGAGIG